MECGIIFWVNALKVINLATMSTQASWKYVNLFKVLYGIYTHLWFKGCSGPIFFFLISNICIDKKGNPSTLEVNQGKEITNKNYKSLGNQ